jgi:hypothetical protein
MVITLCDPSFHSTFPRCRFCRNFITFENGKQRKDILEAQVWTMWSGPSIEIKDLREHLWVGSWRIESRTALDYTRSEIELSDSRQEQPSCPQRTPPSLSSKMPKNVPPRIRGVQVHRVRAKQYFKSKCRT